MSQEKKQAGKHGPEKNAEPRTGDVLVDVVNMLEAHRKPGEPTTACMDRLLGELAGLRAMVGSDATGRGLFVRYEDGPGYEHGGSYSLHRIEVVPGTVQVTAERSLGRVVGSELKDVTKGPFHQVREAAALLMRDWVPPKDLR